MLWYDRPINVLFKSYVDTMSHFHNLSNPIDRIIFISKCIGYLDCLFNRKIGLRYKDYRYLKLKLYLMFKE